jgi:hypothetical protein
VNTEKYVKEMFSSRPLARVYIVYLREQWYKILLEKKIFSLSLPTRKSEEFTDIYQSCIVEKKNLLCEFYLHNYVILIGNSICT